MNNIKAIKGNIFTSTVQTRVNTVNCVGVMGAGIALEYKYRYPEMFEKYKSYCDSGHIQIGKLWLYSIPNSEHKVLNFPTKKHWKYPSKYEYLEKGLKRFVETYREKNIESIAFPLLGAQNGKLDIIKVKNLMLDYLSNVDIPVEIYEFSPDAKDDLIDNLIEFFENNSNEGISKEIGLKKSSIVKIRTVITTDKLHSLIQLREVKGIGDESIKSCFEFFLKKPITLNGCVLPEVGKPQTIKGRKVNPASQLSLDI